MGYNYQVWHGMIILVSSFLLDLYLSIRYHYDGAGLVFMLGFGIAWLLSGIRTE